MWWYVLYAAAHAMLLLTALWTHPDGITQALSDTVTKCLPPPLLAPTILLPESTLEPALDFVYTPQKTFPSELLRAFSPPADDDGFHNSFNDDSSFEKALPAAVIMCVTMVVFIARNYKNADKWHRSENFPADATSLKEIERLLTLSEALQYQVSSLETQRVQLTFDNRQLLEGREKQNVQHELKVHQYKRALRSSKSKHLRSIKELSLSAQAALDRSMAAEKEREVGCRSSQKQLDDLRTATDTERSQYLQEKEELEHQLKSANESCAALTTEGDHKSAQLSQQIQKPKDYKEMFNEHRAKWSLLHQQELDDRSATINSLQDDLTAVRAQCGVEIAEKGRLSTKINCLDGAIAGQNKHCLELTSEKDKAEKRVRDLDRALSAVNGKIVEHQNTIRALQTNEVQLKAQADLHRNDNLRAELQAIRESYAKLEAEKERVEMQSAEKTAQLDEQQVTIDQLQEQIDEAQTAIPHIHEQDHTGEDGADTEEPVVRTERARRNATAKNRLETAESNLEALIARYGEPIVHVDRGDTTNMNDNQKMNARRKKNKVIRWNKLELLHKMERAEAEGDQETMDRLRKEHEWKFDGSMA